MTRRRARLVAAVVLLASALTVVATGCRDRGVLGGEAFRSYTPPNAHLVADRDDGGSSVIQPGESIVIRTFEPIAPATTADVVTALVDEGTRSGWTFTQRDAAGAFGSKRVGENMWTVAIADRDGTVTQVFSGR